MLFSDLPFSPACENNKAPILRILSRAFHQRQHVLEIGSGTGQHAVYFAEQLKHVTWQASDQPANLANLNTRLNRAALPNLPAAIALDIRQTAPPLSKFDAVFTANTLHIMSWPTVKELFATVATLTQPQATLCIYGPFNVNGQYTSESNRAFNLSLKQRDPVMGLRQQEAVIALASEAGFYLKQICSMPANNQLLWFEKQA